MANDIDIVSFPVWDTENLIPIESIDGKPHILTREEIIDQVAYLRLTTRMPSRYVETFNRLVEYNIHAYCIINDVSISMRRDQYAFSLVNDDKKSAVISPLPLATHLIPVNPETEKLVETLRPTLLGFAAALGHKDFPSSEQMMERISFYT